MLSNNSPKPAQQPASPAKPLPSTGTTTRPPAHKATTAPPGPPSPNAAATVIRFHQRTCQPCPVRQQCTDSTNNDRQISVRPRLIQEILDQARIRQTTTAWKNDYAIRSGIGSTIHQAVATIGIRRARYQGKEKVHLQHIYAAIALNLIHLNAWWNGHPLERTRTSHLNQLKPAPAA
ncbi:transposase [Streptosporangium sp. NPDC049376]|uniref:transposase n=1 Tax=Streptosporangium sp. NPDC049376 TaxID=3366192 RepID=UPI0037A16CBE